MLSAVQRGRGPRARGFARPVFDFADGGAEDERTLRRNEQAFNEVPIRPGHSTGSDTGSL
jgi:isopentenyl diphosphate isomerase/L-lactate dehydrogenase-like FMN-dependent dehydrogenase